MKLFKKIVIILPLSVVLLLLNDTLINALSSCSSLWNSTCTESCSSISSSRAYCVTEADDSPLCKDCPDEKEYIHCIVGAYDASTCFYRDYYVGGGYTCKRYGDYCTKSIDATYPNGSSCLPCCTPSCPTNCSYTCPSGYISTNNSCAVTTSVSCSLGSDGCGGSCGSKSYTCYLVETNVAPSMPSSVSIIVDGVTYDLSTNSATPTRIKLPSTASNVQVSVPTTTFPSTSDGGGYAFKGFNDGVNDEWSAITTCTPTSCSGVDGEDFFIQNTTNTQNFDPTSQKILKVLKEKSDGKIAGMYYTKDKCDSDKRYSLPIEGYYIVDTIPSHDNTIDITNDTTAKNCTSNTYTGLEINNPLKFNTTITDSDSNSEIEALIIWFSKDETTPSLVDITETYTQSNTNDFGVMIRKNAGSWNSPRIYSTNADNTWRLLTAADKIAVQNLTITEESSVTISFGLEFKPTSNNPSGLYNVYGAGLDSYMINNKVVDQSRMTDFFNWGIDLVNPSVDEITQQIVDVSNFLLTWEASESESSLKEVVLNGYRTGEQINSRIELFAPPTYEDSKGYIDAIPIPPEAEIGIMGDHDASWEFVDIATYNDLFTAGWFNNNWLYRKPVTISNSTGVTRSNEDVLITLDTKELIDNGRLQSDCGDLRFLDNNDTTRLSYWIENGCNTTNTNIWVRVPSLPSAGKTIYMYYSNPAATNGTEVWNGEVTMLADAACPQGWVRNSAFDNRIPYGATTYGSTGGSSSHHHYLNPPVTLSIGNTTKLPSAGTVITTASTKHPLTPSGVLKRTSHSHSVTVSDTNVNSLPPYRTMVFCKKAGIDVQTGLIAMFKSSTLQSGWTRFSALDGRYPYGGVTYGAIGGSDSHTHSLMLNVSSSGNKLDARSGTARTAVQPSHTHSTTYTVTNASHIPPSIRMVFAKNTGSNDLTNTVLMTNSLPPIGWSTFSTLTSRYPVGSATYDSSVIGSSNHNHLWSAEFPSITTPVTISSTEGESYAVSSHSHPVLNMPMPSVDNLPSYTSTIFTTRKDTEIVSIGPELRKGETWPLVGVTDLKNVTSKINIGDNEGGAINMYVTAYDQACNYNSDFDNIDLNPWLTAKGGTVYSTSGITNSAKDVAGLPDLEDVFENLTSEELDTGTELISARNDILPELLHPELKAVRALNIYDSNDRKTYWFDHFKDKLDSNKVATATKIATPTSSCPSGICYVYSTEDITIANGFECTSKILVMSEGNITINPDITSSSTNTGCIFLAKENIYIGAGTYKTGSNTNVHYDYIDAYLMAQGQIIFNLVDIDKSIRDGIEIHGGLVAFGNGLTTDSAIDVLRNLKLLNVSNPTIVTSYDYKYPNIATLFFGVEAPIYKQEIGFKSF